MKRTILTACLVLASTTAFAYSDTAAKLKASTTPAPAAGVAGRLDSTVPEHLVFHAAGQPELSMSYLSVTEFSMKTDDAFHLGFFPAMFWGMVAPRPKVHTVTVSYKDVAGGIQVATFELSKDGQAALEAVLYARALNACVRREYGSCMPVVTGPAGQRTPLSERKGIGSATAAVAVTQQPAQPPASR